MNIPVIEHEIALNIRKDLVQVKETVYGMVEFSKSLEVVSSESFKVATQLWKQAKDWKKTIDQQRKEFTEPYRKQVTAINDKAKELTDPLTEIEEIVKHKTDLYQKLLEKQREEELQKKKEAAEMIGISEMSVYVPPLEKSIRGEGAIAYTKTEKRFKVTDLAKVPLKYLTIDEKSLENDIKLGIAEIPGIEIYEEKIVQLRSR